MDDVLDGLRVRGELAAATDVVMVNSYRLGDSVAAYMLRCWVDTHFGTKLWYLEQPNGSIRTLEGFTADVKGPPFVLLSKDPPGNVRFGNLGDRMFRFNDLNLWLWNDLFLKTGFTEPEFTLHDRRHPWRVVFAPLLYAEYAQERNFHPRFAYDVACWLAKRFGPEAVVLAEELLPCDAAMFRDAGLTVVTNTPLTTAIDIIGSAELLIAGDSGLGHVGGRFPALKQIALHDRSNTATHRESEYDHLKAHREYVQAVSGYEGFIEYSSFACKGPDGCAQILFDNHGLDGKTLGRVISVGDTWL